MAVLYQIAGFYYYLAKQYALRYTNYLQICGIGFALDKFIKIFGNHKDKAYICTVKRKNRGQKSPYLVLYGRIRKS